MQALFAENLRLLDRQLSNGRPVLCSSVDLPAGRPDILQRLRHWAAVDPQRLVLTEWQGRTRRVLTYGHAVDLSDALHTLLVERYRLGPGERVATLVPAGIDALLLKLASLRGGFVLVSLPPYPFRRDAPADAGEPFLAMARPELTIAPAGHPILAGSGVADASALIALAHAAAARPAAPPSVGRPDDPAAVFFTSGSTGAAKAVVVTRGMISSNQAAIAALWPFIAEQPILVDWLPWHHVFGGLDNIFKVIWNGGTMHIDAAPDESTAEPTARLLAEVQPTLHIAVPLALKLLLDRLEADPAAARAFTARLRAIFFAGAGIDAVLWQRLVRFRDAVGHFEILSGYGTTEAASTICLSPAPIEGPGELGHPLPGHEISLADVDGRFELCVRGPNVAPSYLAHDGLRPLPLDQDGFYRTGDAVLVRHRTDGRRVLAFDGRLADDFKLSSGVRVRTGSLRAGLIAHCAPLADEIVVDGENRDRLVALIFPAPGHVADPDLSSKIGKAIAAWNQANGGNSTTIARFAIARDPPVRSRGELSDKGQIVRSRFLRNNAAMFEALHAGAGHSPQP